jgi:hypothetical protein
MCFVSMLRNRNRLYLSSKREGKSKGRNGEEVTEI